MPAAIDGGRVPVPAAWTGDSLFIKGGSDSARRHSFGIVCEYLPDDCRLFGVNLALACGDGAIFLQPADHPVAITVATGDFARLDATSLTASGLGCEVFEKQRIHRSLQTNMQFADLAFSQRDDPATSMGETFVNSGDIFLIAAQPVEGFR
ncbi:MAG: hypothetical protein RIC36_14765 [Rhodospirillales bacterium]